MKIFLQNVVHEYLLSLIKKKSFLAMQEYFSGLLSTHEIFHSIFLCMNNFFVLKKLLTSCPVRYKIHSLSLWASYCCLSNDPGWGGNKNDSVSISCSGTMTFNTHFFCNWKALFASMIWRLNHSKVFSQSQYIHSWHFSTLSFWKTGTYEGYFIEGSNTIYIDETGLTTNLKCSHFWVAKDLRNCSGYSFQPFANPINHSFYYSQASCFKI